MCDCNECIFSSSVWQTTTTTIQMQRVRVASAQIVTHNNNQHNCIRICTFTDNNKISSEWKIWNNGRTVFFCWLDYPTLPLLPSTTVRQIIHDIAATHTTANTEHCAPFDSHGMVEVHNTQCSMDSIVTTDDCYVLRQAQLLTLIPSSCMLPIYYEQQILFIHSPSSWIL